MDVNFYRITWTKFGEDPKLKLLVYNEDHKDIIYVDFPFRPYFFIKKEDFSKKYKDWILNNNGEISEFRDFVKVELPTPDLVSKFRRENRVETWEGDIPYARRVMIDCDLSVGEPLNKLYFDIEVDPVKKINVQDPQARILSIAAVDDKGNEFFFSDKDEVNMILDFLRLSERYVVAVGYYAGRFDYPYLRNRAKLLGIDYDWFKFVFLDLYSIYRYVLHKSVETYRLDYISELELGQKKYRDLEREGKIQLLREWFEKKSEELRKYNMQDAVLCKELDEKLGMVDLVFRIAQISHTTFDYIFSYREEKKRDFLASVVIDSLVLNLSKKRGENRVIFPSRRRFVDMEEETYSGGYVKDPVPGLHRDVVVLDFSGAYNTAFKVLNIGWETWRRDKSGEIKALHGSYTKEPRGLFAETVEILEKLRAKYKGERKKYEPGTKEWKIYDTLQFACKTILLSVTGILGYKHSRFYRTEHIENCTTMVRDCIIRMIQIVEEDLRLKVLGADTDSLFIKVFDPPLRPKVEVKGNTIVEKAYNICDFLNKKLKEYCRVVYNTDPLVLSVDKIYSKLFVFPVKKRYAGIVTYEDGNECFYLKYVGIEAVKKDTPPAVREFQRELLRMILAGYRMSEIVKYANEIKERLFKGRLDEGLVVWKGLNKPIEEYAVDAPHVRVAKILEAEGHQVRTGDKIGFIRYGPDKRDVEPYYIGRKTKIPPRGYKYLWDNQFVPILERLGLSAYTSRQTKLEGFVRKSS